MIPEVTVPFPVGSYTDVIRRGKAGDDLDAVNYPNQAENILTVTFPAMQTTVASNGYCLLIADDVDPRAVLLGANDDNGEQFGLAIAAAATAPQSIKWTGYWQR